MSHEKSITVGLGKRYRNLKTALGPTQNMGAAGAVAYFKSSGRDLGGPYPDVDTAVRAAKKRSALSRHSGYRVLKP